MKLGYNILKIKRFKT